MTFAPLLSAAPAIQIHAFAAMAAFVLGIEEFAAPKGTLPHRTIGWIWVGLMTAVCISAFFIHTINFWGRWSPIHLLALYTAIALPAALLAARRRNVRAHKRAMTTLFISALVIAGAFTFMPGRIMHAVAFEH